MKKLAFLFIILAAVLFTAACSQQAKVDTLLTNPKTKDKVFSAILDNHEMMSDFMKKMMSNHHAEMMLQDNNDMMSMMLKSEHMMQMMQDNPEMMHQMMGNMMKNGKMMEEMVQMMHKDGMMSDDCLEACMQNMSNQGMMKNGGNEKKEGTGHEAHH